MVSETGITPLPKHVAAIQEFPPPSTVKQLQQFLGMIHFYRRFLPKIAATLRPLTDLLRGNPKTLDWSAAAADAFAAAKAALVSAVPLSHPTPGAALSLAVDASDSHVGGVLQQLGNRAWRPLAFFSQKLSPAQVRYSTFDRELLAAYSAVRHFRFLLEGRKFRILTDHKPLVAAMTRVTPPWSGRQQRHLSFLAEFTSDLRHTSGHSNVVADTLSRPSPEKSKESAAAICKTAPAVAFPFPAALHASKTAKKPEPADLCTESSDARPPQPPAAAPAAIDFQALAAAQQSCPEVAAMSSSPSLQTVRRPAGDAHLLGDISTGTFRPLVPPIFRQTVIRSLHEVHHPGVRATTRLVKASFCWPKMGRDIAAAARSCMGCQLGKIHRHVKLQPEPVPRRHFSHLHIDLVGPLPKSAGYTHLFTIMDRTTRWPEAVPVSATSATDCAAALFSEWVQRFGLPAAITSDRGPQFTSAVWAALCRLLNIRHIPTTAYHPQSNGLVERFHRRLKDALRARAAGDRWTAHLPWVMLGIRSAWREGTSFSPAEAVYGAQPLLPGQYLAAEEDPSPSFLSDLQQTLAGRTLLPTSHHSTPAPQELPEVLLLAKHVLVRQDGHVPPLAAAYNGPFLVLERSLRFFKLQIGDRVDTVSTLRRKPCTSPPDVEVAQPPKRGRPAAAAAAPLPEVISPPTQRTPPQRAKRRRHVTFRCPAVTPPSSPAQRLHPSGRPARSAGPPRRYMVSRVSLLGPRLGGELWRDDIY
jgi:hypothetical protein